MARNIVLPGPHPRLKPRRQKGKRMIPGTAVTMDDHLFEIVSARSEEGNHIYSLEPWPEGQDMNHHVTWTKEKEELFRMECLFSSRDTQPPHLLLASLVLIGFLPAEMQRKLSESWEFEPSRATLYSSILQFFLSLPFFVYETLLHVTGNSIMPVWLWLTTGYLALESGFRAGGALFLDEPTGTLFLSFLGWNRNKDSREDLYGDLVSARENELWITSHFPKNHLERAGIIRLEDRYYRFLEKKTLRFSTIYHFIGTIRDEDAPELSLEDERKRNRAADRTYVLSPLWGFLPCDWQIKFASLGLYRPLRFTLFSILCILFLAIPAMILDLAQWALKGPTVTTLIRLPVALFFVQESVMRITHLIKDKKPSGSLPGLLLIPLAKRLFSGIVP
ncbi:MAG TPA: hypothetical protein PK014_12145 [Thermoanaerobaculia bacterium]|nr:hypothetical protein [Thermoanaerobaculia bacterium]HUM30817.1 hypothetical protein [Thermoanaerobaculia bacterium]HXK69152.1 hypothetical protein [Thermoanaerobaculia bacterium]